ncbi:MAG: hypothetical protein ACRDRV_13865 [Pseudonocardiaceae bacterium]
MDSRGRRLDELAEAVSSAPGVLPRSVRRALAGGGRISGELGELADLVAAGGAGVTDGLIRRLLVSGYSEDVVFECVVAAAVGAGTQRLRAVERLLVTCRQGCPR